MKKYFHLMVIALTIFCFSSSAEAEEVYIGFLSGGQEVAVVESSGSGIGTATLDGNLLTINLSFEGLTTPTADAHIHCCAPYEVNGPVAIGFSSTGFPLGVTSGSYSNTFDLNLASTFSAAFITARGGTVELASAAFVDALRNGQTYFNIHTQQYRGGEIRGQIQPVPEPATMVLLGTGLAGIGAAVRKRRKR